MEQDLSRFKYWIYIYTALVLWNLFTTWWVWFASPAGAVAMLLLNSALMSIPFLAYRFTKQILGDRTGYWPLIVYWIGFEYFHLNWDIEWPWLTVGNGFATMPSMVQWYEYTGVLGGTLWVWVVNIAIFNLLNDFSYKRIVKPSLLIFIPVFLSVVVGFSYSESLITTKAEKNDIIIIQPNIDPYNEKFDSINGLTIDEQLNIILELTKQKINTNTKFVLFPETALMGDLDEGYLNSSRTIIKVKNFLKDYPNTTIVAGADSYKFYFGEDEKPTATARLSQSGVYYDYFNSAIMINHLGAREVYHKSKLVPGVEKMPYPKFFSFLDALSADLGGTSGGLGRNKEAEVFWTEDSAGVAPIICYESVFGEYVTDYVRKGAGMLFIITNDGWWKNTPGYKQHLHYARLRAIETRRDIARCANTGISCFIKANGSVNNTTKWWEPAVIKGSFTPKHKITFYTQWGDYIGRIAGFIAIAFLLSSIVRRTTKKHDYLK